MSNAKWSFKSSSCYVSVLQNCRDNSNWNVSCKLVDGYFAILTHLSPSTTFGGGWSIPLKVFKCLVSLFCKVQWTISHHWFRRQSLPETMVTQFTVTYILFSDEFVIWPDRFVGHSYPGGYCPESGPLSLTCSIITLLGTLLMIDTPSKNVFMGIRVLNLIVIIKSEVGLICHETMVCAAYLSIFLCITSSNKPTPVMMRLSPDLDYCCVSA